MMDMPELVFVTGCNAAGKSTFIRTRLERLVQFEVIMTDVYKGRTKELAKKAITLQKNVVIETVFNDASFSRLADAARSLGYQTSLIVLFLDSIQQSINRVTTRGIQQNGITISGSNVKINFNESFKNVASYFFYFDRSDFIYTGTDGLNQPIMSFNKSELIAYHANELSYPQKFATFGFQHQRLNENAYKTITSNKDFKHESLATDHSDNNFKG